MLIVCHEAGAQTRIVELTVYADSGSHAGAQHEWMQSLSKAGADRISSVIRSGVRPTIDEEEFGGSTIVMVKGVLKGGRLHLPGKKFTRADIGGVKRYLQKLKLDPANVAMAEKKAFGLTVDQLRDVHKMLSVEVTGSTAGQSAKDAVRMIVRETGLSLQMDTDIRARLAAANDSLLDEHQSLSAGTSLASILNESGLALVPMRPPGGVIEFRVKKQADASESWPIGWPSEQPPVALEPRLFQRQDIRIERFPLGDALTAVGKRCGVILLYNRQNISKHDIDLQKTEATFVRKQVSYMITLAKLLRQSKPAMDIDVRVDEAGTPFAWIDVRE